MDLRVSCRRAVNCPADREELVSEEEKGWPIIASEGWTAVTDASRRTAVFMALTAVAVLASFAAPAQTYSTRPVRIIVASSAGGFIDVAARMFAAGLSEKGQPVV